MGALAVAHRERAAAADAMRAAGEGAMAVSGSGSRVPDIQISPGAASPHPAGPDAAAGTPARGHSVSLPGAMSGHGGDAAEAGNGGVSRNPNNKLNLGGAWSVGGGRRLSLGGALGVTQAATQALPAASGGVPALDSNPGRCPIPEGGIEGPAPGGPDSQTLPNPTFNPNFNPTLIETTPLRSLPRVSASIDRLPGVLPATGPLVPSQEATQERPAQSGGTPDAAGEREEHNAPDHRMSGIHGMETDHGGKGEGRSPGQGAQVGCISEGAGGPAAAGGQVRTPAHSAAAAAAPKQPSLSVAGAASALRLRSSGASAQQPGNGGATNSTLNPSPGSKAAGGAQHSGDENAADRANSMAESSEVPVGPAGDPSPGLNINSEIKPQPMAMNDSEEDPGAGAPGGSLKAAFMQGAQPFTLGTDNEFAGMA